MAKQPKFTPQRSKESKLPWRVNIPAQCSESGKRERVYFKTKSEAETFAEQQKARIKNHGTATELLTPAQRDAATKAFELLGDDSPARLIDIVKEHLTRERQKRASVAISALCNQFAASKGEKSSHYKAQLHYAFALLQQFGDRLVNEVEPLHISQLVESLTASSRNAHLRVFRAAFNFAIKKDWCTTNPVEKLDFSEIKRTEVEVLPHDVVTRLLKMCAEKDLGLLPYHLFGLFAGIRPMELERMQWEHVRDDERHILLPPEVTKTGMRRVIEMERPLCVWLRTLYWKKGKPCGQIVAAKNLRKHLRELRKTANIEKWVQDVMRHTYASNWLAKFENVDRLRANMGHRSNDVLWNHYHRAVLRKDAEAFWQLTPKVVMKGNIAEEKTRYP